MFSERKQLNMKKILLISMLLSTLCVKAADYSIQSFLAGEVASLLVSNSTVAHADRLGVTNLASTWIRWGNADSATNDALGVCPTAWTNKQGVLKVVNQSNITNYDYHKINLLSAVNLYPPPGGGRWEPDNTSSQTVNVWANTNFVVPLDSGSGGYQGPQVIVELQGGAAFDGAVTFAFTPVVIDRDGTVIEPSNTTADWLVSFTGTASTAGTNRVFSTNAPMARFNGFNGLMLRTISNDDNTAAANTECWIKKVLFCGWRP